MMRLPLLSLPACAVLLAACGAGSNSGLTPAGPPPSGTVSRGQLLQSPPAEVASFSPAELATLLGGSSVGPALAQVAFNGVCSVAVYEIDYETVDPTGALTPASGALMVPGGLTPRALDRVQSSCTATAHPRTAASTWPTSATAPIPKG